MMKKADAKRYRITSIADLAQYIDQHPREIAFATDTEFYQRPDGFPALEETYGFEFPRDKVKVMSWGLTYDALKDGEVQVAMGFATDGRIQAFNFINLKDDKQFFPAYNVAPCLRKDFVAVHPSVCDILAPIAPRNPAEK